MKKKTEDCFPSILRVGGHNVVVEWVDSLDEGEDGSTTCGDYSGHPRYVIRVCRHAAETNLIDTLFHELSHAIWDIYGISEGNQEEQIVCIMASAWTQILRDNPRFFLGMVEVMVDHLGG